MEGRKMELRNITDDRNIIEKVVENSIAQELEIRPGDILLSINGSRVKDIIDYKYLISDEYIEVEIEKADGEVWILEIEKEIDEDLGIIFTNPLIDRAKTCRNKCIFCFIDQLPPNMRETLYFKDDDSRLSFLQGNFITLTNMNDEEIDRIIKYRLSPINVSVHTTNPELRVKMLNNKNAGNIFSILKRFKEADIKVNCQIVLVPNVNDGMELKRTLKDLSSLYPSVESVAVVPVGLTRYRENLCKIQPFNQERAMELISMIKEEQYKYLSKLGTRLVFLSDEFYAMTNEPLPPYEAYEGFPQLENGVGLMRSFEYEIDEELNKIDYKLTVDKKYIIATGKLAARFMNRIKAKIENKFTSLKLEVIPIENDFFGRSITVSGLITGQDIIKQIKTYETYKDYDGIVIPKSMLRKDTNIFLDDITTEYIERELGIEIIPVEVSGKEFIKFIRSA